MEPIDASFPGPGTLTGALSEGGIRVSALAFRDLVALSGGHDFLLQASNAMCAETAFVSTALPWLVGRLDAYAVAALRSSGAVINSAVLQEAIAAPVVPGHAAADVLLFFQAHDVLFEGGASECRVRLGVSAALGSLFVPPKEPGLEHGLRPGEAVEQMGEAVSELARTLVAAGAALQDQVMTMRTLSYQRPTMTSAPKSISSERSSSFTAAPDHLDLGDGRSFQVSAWLGSGLLEIPAHFAAAGNAAAATITVTADVHESEIAFTQLSGDVAALLAEADPLGLVEASRQRVRERGNLALVDELSLVGSSSTARVPHLDAFTVDGFPCGQGSCPLNVTATIAPGRVGARNAIDFVGASRYGVLWSADAGRLLVRYCWETGAFPRRIVQTSSARVTIDGVEQEADAISVFQLDTLDVIALEYDGNGREDVLYTRGVARVVPQLIRLQDGRELFAKDPDDPVFAPSDPQPWAALGNLTDEPVTASSPDVLWFEKAMTNGVTARLGRPFTEGHSAEVIESRVSAPAQCIALLVR